jgi:hypothetical protein
MIAHVQFASLLAFVAAACCGCGSGSVVSGTGFACACIGLCCCCAYSAKIRVFAAAIARAEGYGVTGAIPTVNNNPGDLMMVGDAGRDAHGYAVYSTPNAGWNALYHQVSLYVAGASASGINLNSTILDLARKYTGTQQAVWAQNVADYLGGSVNDKLSIWLS